ncbi:TasA family protein [Brevibacillus fluminis]|uniref:TasA family protein n=1 Tax=Brevibacillus fluminis TaxID=511487 RepID=UPI003F8BB535
MSLKKALGMGVATAALGMSLIGGGTFAAFTDTEDLQNSYAAGTLNLELQTMKGGALGTNVFSSTLKNLKPGDSVSRTFKLVNAGTLSIKDVKLQATYPDKASDNSPNYIDGTNTANPNYSKLDAKYRGSAFNNTADEFADQIWVQVYGGDLPNANKLVWEGKLSTLKTLWTPDITDKTANKSLPAIPVDDDGVTVKLTFNADAGNKFQGDMLKQINFQFAASQFNGKQFNDGDNIDNSNATQTDN